MERPSTSLHHLLCIELIHAIALIHRHITGNQHFHPMSGLKLQPLGITAKHNALDSACFIFQRKIQMTGTVAGEIGNLAPHQQTAQLGIPLQQHFDMAVDSADR